MKKANITIMEKAFGLLNVGHQENCTCGNESQHFTETHFAEKNENLVQSGNLETAFYGFSHLEDT